MIKSWVRKYELNFHGGEKHLPLRRSVNRFLKLQGGVRKCCCVTAKGRQCSKTATNKFNGKWYCTQHLKITSFRGRCSIQGKCCGTPEKPKTKIEKPSQVFAEDCMRDLLRHLGEHDKRLIKTFCSTENTKCLENISDFCKRALIDHSYSVLFHKYGNLKIAKLVLTYYDEIKLITYKEGLNETREFHKIKKQDWKKMSREEIERIRGTKTAAVYTGKQRINGGYESLKKR